MEPPTSKLNHETAPELEAASQQQHASRQEQGRDFETVEAMLRCDAAQTVPPPGIAERLAASVAREPRPARSWWQKLTGQ